jgi:hypothetical protein
MGALIPRAWLYALIVGVFALCAGVGARALDGGATRGSGDSTGPLSIKWLSPRDGSTVRGLLRDSTCDVTVHDIIPIKKVTFDLDGSTFRTDTAPPYSCAISAATLSPGMHILEAKAYDAAGNAHSTYIHVSARWTARPGITVTVQGDSLTVGSWSQLPADLGLDYSFVSYSAHWGRPSVKGLALLRRQRLGRVVVFALGTNDWRSSPIAYRRQLTSVLQMIGPSRCLVVATIWRHGPNRPLNAVLYALARRYGSARIQLAHWSEAVASGRIRLSPDGTHPDSRAAWNSHAAILASAIRACGPVG